jgi:mono/diheme cytochrome c family protein
MPAYSALNDQQVFQLVDYLLSLTGGSAPVGGTATTASASHTIPTVDTATAKLPGKAAFIIGSAEHGALLYEKYCASCHGPRGAGQIPNPGSTDGTVPALNPINPKLYNANPQLFAANIDLAIQYGSQPTGPHPALVMPAFGNNHALTQAEIADLEAYILDLNGVQRGEIMHPGIQPMKFLLAVSAVFFVLVTIVLYLLNVRKRT